ncbi:MAG: FtsK/SpoIIIE domain-containing protein [Christensenellales bacterium]
MEFKQIKTMADSFNARFAKVISLEKEIAEAIVRNQQALEEKNKKLHSNMEKSVDAYVKAEIEKIRIAIDSMLDSFGVSEKNVVVDTNNLISDEFEINKSTVLRLIAEINDIVSELNKYDFEKNAPLLKVSEVKNEDETFTIANNGKSETIGVNAKENDYFSIHNPQKEILEKLPVKAVQCKKVLDAMEADIRRRFTLNEFDKYLKKCENEYMHDCASTLNKEMALTIKRQLQIEDDVLREDRFKELYESGLEGKVDTEKGSMNYPTKINLGDIKYDYIKNKDYKKYLNEKDCPLLNKYTPDGKMTAPYVLELRKNGNIFIEVGESKLSTNTIKFVQKIMLSFLMSFPIGRLNYRLIDLDDTGEFADFNQLNALSANMFKKTYNDDTRVSSAMVDMDERMGDIYDNKITLNGVKNIYDYNVISENDPQSFELLTVVGFPECFGNEKTVKRLKKIVENGNRSGIFSLIVYNNANPNKAAYVNDFVIFAKQSMNYFEVVGDKIYLNGDKKCEFLPNEELVYDDIPSYTQVLKQNAKKGVNKVIPLSKMFEATEKVENTDDFCDPTEVIDIPIGMRGGETQTLAFSSKGDGAAHALAIGGTGSGKSNLLHTIVLSACYKYSPDDLNIYLVDFKGGVEFKYYEANRNINKQLPHIKLTALSSDPEDGLAVLANIDKELTRRETLFRNKEVEDIMQYKKRFGVLPRLLVIIDEVQELFERDQNIGSYAINLMSKLFKKGRAFGINVLWASQNVPKVAGLRDKIISQIGSRISLKLNNPEDAQELDINVQKIKNLSNTLGVGVIKDTRTGQNSVEFRVAYAETSDNRGMYSEKINEKWQSVVEKWTDREPLFVVGSNLEEPRADEGITPYTSPVDKTSLVSKSMGDYNIAVGKGYISGKPYSIPIHLRGSNSNLWFAGANVEELRDMMGFAMLSVLMENRTNKDFVGDDSTQIYYFNGEVIDQKNPDDLFFVLPKCFSRSVQSVCSITDLGKTLVQLYNLRRKRAENIQANHNPVFLFINKIQEVAVEFKDTSKLIDLAENSEAAPIATSATHGFSLGLGIGGMGASAGGSKMTFAQLFNEVFENGPNQNIHIIFSIDKPSSIPSINNAMRNCQNKVFIKGLDTEAITSVASFRSNINITIEGMGICLKDTEMNKFKPYRYYSDRDAEWLKQLVDNYEGLWN